MLSFIQTMASKDILWKHWLAKKCFTTVNISLISVHLQGSLCDGGFELQQSAGTKLLLSDLTIHRREVNGYTKMALHFSIHQDEQDFWYFLVPASDGTRTIEIERTITGFSEISKFAKWQDVMPEQHNSLSDY